MAKKKAVAKKLAKVAPVKARQVHRERPEPIMASTRKKHIPTSVRIPKREPWHVLKDLSVIADAIAEFTAASPTELMRRICENRHPVVLVLAAGLHQRFEKLIHIEGIGTVSIRNLALRSLRNDGLGHAADEVNSQLSNLLNRLPQWEKKWRDTIKNFGSMISEGQQLFPDDFCREFDEIEEYAEGTIAMLRQLVSERQAVSPLVAELPKLADGTRSSQKGAFAKPRRSTRRCKSRDEQFVAWRDAGLSAKDIAAKWNRGNTDDVSEGNVRQILSRSKV